MENIKKTTNDNTEAPAPNHTFEKTKAYQDFMNALSQIIKKHGAEIESREIMKSNCEKSI